MFMKIKTVFFLSCPKFCGCLAVFSCQNSVFKALVFTSNLLFRQITSFASVFDIYFFLYLVTNMPFTFLLFVNKTCNCDTIFQLTAVRQSIIWSHLINERLPRDFE